MLVPAPPDQPLAPPSPTPHALPATALLCWRTSTPRRRARESEQESEQESLGCDCTDLRFVRMHGESERVCEVFTRSQASSWKTCCSLLACVVSPHSPVDLALPRPSRSRPLAPRKMAQDEVHRIESSQGDVGVLSYAPLDPAAIEESLRNESDGAVVSFVRPLVASEQPVCWIDLTRYSPAGRLHARQLPRCVRRSSPPPPPPPPPPRAG